MRQIYLWDLPLRLFHWLLFVLIVAAAVTGQLGGGLMEWHGRIGVAIAALLGFRLTWGFAGATYARFATFVRGPGAIVAYLRGQWQGVGHNPLGALSVIGLLTVITLQVVSGLFSYDDIAFRGPYNALVGADLEALAITVHKRNVWLLALLVALHLAAIAFYARIKGENLVQPMLTGNKVVDARLALNVRENTGGGPVALGVALATALLFGWMAAGGPVPWLQPPPPPAVETPAW